jgi:RNA recognition motif-containing protein
MKNIYVGNLSFNTNDKDLRGEFGKYGEVISVKIIQDGMTHQSRGFGFVEMADDKAALDAIAGLNGSSLNGRTLTVNEARARSERHDAGGHRPRRRFGT